MRSTGMIPVLSAYRSPDGLLFLVWCEYCRRYHRHRAPLSQSPRLAHCDENMSSPYSRSGYKLLDAGPAPADVLREAGYARPRW